MFIHAVKATVSAGALQEEQSEVHTWVLNVRKSFSLAPLARRNMELFDGPTVEENVSNAVCLINSLLTSVPVFLGTNDSSMRDSVEAVGCCLLAQAGCDSAGAANVKRPLDLKLSQSKG